MDKASPIALATMTALLAFSGVAFAQDGAQSPLGIPPAPTPRHNVILIKEKRADLREAVKDVLDAFKTGAKDLRIDTKENMRSATSSTERREIEKNAIEQRRVLIDARKASTTEIRDRRKELAREHVGKIGQRYSVAIKQFDNLASRIQSRIDKLRANGTDVSKAETALALAQTAISQVKTDARALADLLAQVNSGDDAKALRAQIEAAVKKVSASIKLAHKALEKAGKALVQSARTQKSKNMSATTTIIQ